AAGVVLAGGGSAPPCGERAARRAQTAGAGAGTPLPGGVMRLRAWVILGALLAAPAAAGAQDSMPDPIRAERLRQLIEQRFGERLKEELGLTDEQASKLQVSLAGLAARRRGMEQDERRMRQALAAQLRPGVAANSDSVAKLVVALTDHRVAYAQTFKDEMRELSTILNPRSEEHT